ncbi:hypothetical protein P3T76_007240 [Phytophthora citrophthora]|uniref:Uncharacterized protein n=1 Tax=Phytophthora citrophthora TaxID=4793 RepID=A0AAD9GMY8_9STRA|nr:hypothetical protein P3T76_007240 [Phytophthora citrophthora]
MSGSVDPSDSASLVSFLLDNLIIFSEMWESPTPPTSVLKTRFEEATMSTGSAYVQTERYCAYTKEKSATCGKLKLGGYKGYGIVYERDEYWNKAATIPGQASVLILSSKLNPLAPHKDAEALLKAMVGDNKELVAFEYTAGSNLMDSSTQELCGMSVLVSYVQNEGKLEKLEKSCVAAEVKTAFYWTPPLSQQYVLLSTSDAYDGEYDKSLSETSIHSGPSNTGESVDLKDLKKDLLGSTDQSETGGSDSTGSLGLAVGDLIEEIGSDSPMSLEEMLDSMNVTTLAP